MIILDIGKLDKQIIIQNAADVSDGAGGRKPSFVDGATVWGNIKPTTGKQFNRAGKISFDMSHIITIRYREGLSPKNNRLKFGNRIFKIMSPENVDEQSRFIEMFCLEVL